MYNSLKVFAEYFVEDKIEYRTRTILKFGDSWDIIGTIVMKNPGSAQPSERIDKKEFENVESIFNDINFDSWYEFKEDKTIMRISNIFDGTYLKKEKELNGIILIYNLFNIRERKIVEAVKKANTSNSVHLLPNLAELLQISKNKPIYLGFHFEYTDKLNKHQSQIELFAKELFAHVKKSQFMYLKDKMIDNEFYHPLSPKITSVKSLQTLKRFYEKMNS